MLNPHLITATASVFPWSPLTDSAMAHKHLMLGYAFAWMAQLLYLAYIFLKQRAQNKTADARKADRR